MSDEFSQCRWPMMPFHQKATSNITEFIRVQASLWEFQEDVEADFSEFRACPSQNWDSGTRILGTLLLENGRKFSWNGGMPWPLKNEGLKRTS